jgi:hypothetical protein
LNESAPNAPLPVLAAAAEPAGGADGGTSGEGGAAADAYTVDYDGTGALEIRVDIPFEEYQDMYFDGELWIRGVDYDARSGSTVLTVPEARLETVADGAHMIRAVFARGNVDIPFVLDRGAPAGTDPPRTAPDSADPANPAVTAEPAGAAAEGGGQLPALRILLAAAAVVTAGAVMIRRGRPPASSHPRRRI